ncbi:MAG: O-antigen ligase family protein [Vicinamibacterales bacterium]
MSLLARRTLIAASLLALAWGALAFGAVYPWAYVPLGIACAVIGAVALVTYRPLHAPVRPFTIAIGSITLVIALQLVPLPLPWLAKVSPGTDRFLRSYDLSYSIGRTSESPDDSVSHRPAHPISIAPERTGRGLALFGAFALFTLGLTAALSVHGAVPLVRGVVALGVVLALIGIIQYAVTGGATYTLKIYGFWTPQYRGSPFGPFINRNHFAGWMLMALPVAVTSAISAASSFRGGGVRAFVAWVSASRQAGLMHLMAGASVIMALSVLIANSRSGLLGFFMSAVLATGLVMRRQRSRRGRVASVLLALALLFGIVTWAGVGGLASRVATVGRADSSAGGRIQAWRGALAITADFPLLGSGLDTFGVAMLQYQTGDRSIHFEEAHNDYLQILAEGGAALGAAVVAAIATVAWLVHARFREAPREGTTYWARTGAVIGMLSIAVQSLMEFSLQMPGNAALFCLLVAIALHRSPNLRVRPSAGQSNYGFDR